MFTRAKVNITLAQRKYHLCPKEISCLPKGNITFGRSKYHVSPKEISPLPEGNIMFAQRKYHIRQSKYQICSMEISRLPNGNTMFAQRRYHNCPTRFASFARRDRISYPRQKHVCPKEKSSLPEAKLPEVWEGSGYAGGVGNGFGPRGFYFRNLGTIQEQCDAIRWEQLEYWHFSRGYIFWANDLILYLKLLHVCIRV